MGSEVSLRILIQIIIISIYCNGIYFCLQDGMILGRLYRFMKKRANEFWSKPLFDCIYCMASFWGVPAYILLNINNLNWLTLAYFPVVIFGVVFTNGFLSEAIELLIDYRKYLLKSKDNNNQIGPIEERVVEFAKQGLMDFEKENTEDLTDVRKIDIAMEVLKQCEAINIKDMKENSKKDNHYLASLNKSDAHYFAYCIQSLKFKKNYILNPELLK